MENAKRNLEESLKILGRSHLSTTAKAAHWAGEPADVCGGGSHSADVGPQLTGGGCRCAFFRREARSLGVLQGGENLPDGSMTCRVGNASPTVPAGSGTVPSLSQVALQVTRTFSDSRCRNGLAPKDAMDTAGQWHQTRDIRTHVKIGITHSP